VIETYEPGEKKPYVNELERAARRAERIAFSIIILVTILGVGLVTYISWRGE
jgi:hypothetical protein